MNLQDTLWFWCSVHKVSPTCFPKHPAKVQCIIPGYPKEGNHNWITIKTGKMELKEVMVHSAEYWVPKPYLKSCTDSEASLIYIGVMHTQLRRHWNYFKFCRPPVRATVRYVLVFDFTRYGLTGWKIGAMAIDSAAGRSRLDIKREYLLSLESLLHFRFRSTLL